MNSAIIGLGVIGKVHYDTLKNQCENIVAICDIDEGKLASFDVERKYTDYKRMIQDGGIDIVHICTPHYLHADMSIFALEHDVNVLCEKPLCINYEDIERIQKAQDESKATFGICFQNRFNNSSVFAKEYLKDKKIKSALALVLWHRGAAYYASGAWRGKKATEGGGVCINQAIHTLDLLQWICGMPEHIEASTDNVSLQGVIEVEDTATAILSGKDYKATFVATNAMQSDLPVEITFGYDGHSLKMLPDKVLIDGEVVDYEKDVKWQGKMSYGNGHEKLIRNFYECVASGKKFEIDAYEAAKAIRIVLAIYKRKNRRIGNGKVLSTQ